MRRLIYPVALMLAASCSQGPAIENMKCEWVEEPLCVDTGTPRFTWTYTGSAGRDFIPAGSHVDVAESRDALRDAGMPVLRPYTEYFWQVRVWNADSSKVLVSPVSRFETGPMCTGDWTAVWISDSRDKDYVPAPMLRRTFTVSEGLEKARLYMSAAAYAEICINGKKASDACLDPGYTAYDKRNLYVALDVTDKLATGDNVISAVLGNGFYNEIQPVATWGFEKAPWRGRARMIASLRMTYSDGTVQTVDSDGSWKATADGPYVSNNIYSGEIYDARKEMEGWQEASFDDSAWEDATVVSAPSPVLDAQYMPAIKSVEEITPVSVRASGDTMYIFDFGRNISGVCEIEVRGEEGTRITLRHSELLRDDGNLEMRNIDCYFNPMPDYEFQTDTYYMKGGDAESWRPSFVYHGFRYVELKSDRPVHLADGNGVKAHYIHSAVASKGDFNCSNELLNTIWEMARRTYVNNLHSIFTDCPQREKNGWTADNFLTTELGLLNYDLVPFFNKWVYDVVDNIRPDGRISGIIPDWGDWGYADWIGPVWDSSIFSIPEYLYFFTGDIGPVRTLWPVYKRYLEYLATREEEDGLPTYGIGDWVYLNVATPTEFTTPCFYYKDYCVMARFAEAMGEDPAPYVRKARRIRDAINAKWFNYDTDLYANGSQAAQGVALYLGIVPDGHEQAVADNLDASVRANGGFLEFGSMGSKTVPRMLTAYGHVDTAYGLTTKEECPSWGGWAKLGYTTLAETWILSPEFRDASLDHAFLGDIAAWYVNDLAGINYDKDAPGFENIIIAPHFPSGLESASASYDSVRGTIRSSWKRTGDSAQMTVEIPVGCTAVLKTGGEVRKLQPGRQTIEVNL